MRRGGALVLGRVARLGADAEALLPHLGDEEPQRLLEDGGEVAGGVLVAEELLGLEEQVPQLGVGGELDLEGVGSEGLDLGAPSRGGGRCDGSRRERDAGLGQRCASATEGRRRLARGQLVDGVGDERLGGEAGDDELLDLRLGLAGGEGDELVAVGSR